MRVVYSRRAWRDIERVLSSVEEKNAAERVLDLVVGAIEMLRWHPHVGRPVRNGLRELVISFGRTGYVALYRVVRSRIEVLAIRHQREVGYR
ncbi:MAG: type II toxin-antitoxin system RelE/ParE family toxin [Myxococcaceae bacterium]|nr:type II toxin-antitoxin system RelE/ParE family toxin [Myxococcaceae bacterium]